MSGRSLIRSPSLGKTVLGAKAVAAGVKIAYGTDSGVYFPHRLNRLRDRRQSFHLAVADRKVLRADAQ